MKAICCGSAYMMRHRLGWWLIRAGAKLALRNDAERDQFKDRINAETWQGAQIETGGHILSEINPMCEYDTQSVIIVLRRGLDVGALDPMTKKLAYYREKWTG